MIMKITYNEEVRMLSLLESEKNTIEKFLNLRLDRYDTIGDLFENADIFISFDDKFEIEPF